MNTKAELHLSVNDMCKAVTFWLNETQFKTPHEVTGIRVKDNTFELQLMPVKSNEKAKE